MLHMSLSRRTRYCLGIVAAVAVICYVFLPVGANAHGSQGDVAHHQKITSSSDSANPVGTWNLTVTFPNGQQEPSQLVFNANGKVVNLSPGPGLGKWCATGKYTFVYSFDEMILVNGSFSQAVHVEQKAILSSDGKTYTASGTGTVYDTAGNQLAVNATTTQAVRA